VADNILQIKKASIESTRAKLLKIS